MAAISGPHLVDKKVAEEIVHGEGLDPSGYRGDEGVVFGTHTREKIRG